MIEQNEQLIKDTLDKIGGGVTMPELAYQTGIPVPSLMEHLAQLQTREEIYPWSYTTPRGHAALMLSALYPAERPSGMRHRDLAPVEEEDRITLGGPRLMEDEG